jgi:hypothetical protein
MQFIDFSPPTSPSPNHQRDALQKGLGRTWIWASSDVLAEELLLEACLQDMRFDQQCEDSRSNWLWKIVQRMGALERFQAPIFEALNRLSDERSANQLCEIAYHYAEIGDQLFRSRLYEIVESKAIVNGCDLTQQTMCSRQPETSVDPSRFADGGVRRRIGTEINPPHALGGE